ncbi:anaphase-promoting complex, cyclosome, subunit 4-domain-containing protein [Clohesyomyces aquaticus]|uniref:Anaphase-promoting complex subunit 4 n=1 Tax=Clohesyomyces aquaticus TaxID=1231657 RepID=A0A1Y1Z6Q6_9PLEO|nr:anaphase-promoting complex, cyclosome, subunit 4-domain-containing protein [Clohesyomyces aquaticus]
MEAAPGPKLLQQAEKILLRPIHPHLISYCPSMDLIAIVTDEENLDVYRINGQRAFGLKRNNDTVSVDAIAWKFNGQSIAVAWSNGFVDVLSAETGKVLHKDVAPPPMVGAGNADGSTVDERQMRIGCIGWGLHFIDVENAKRRTGVRKGNANGTDEVGVAKIDCAKEGETTDNWDAFKDETTLEDFLQRKPDLQALDIAPDLPDQLAMMDVETLLPKLPAIPLPPATPFMRLQQPTDSGAFSAQAQVDAIFHSSHMKDHNAVDVMVRCSDVGTAHPSLYDSLESVNVGLPARWNITKSKTLMHASHPYSCSNGLLMEVKTSSAQTKLAFVPLTLGFIQSAGIYLHLIASKTSQLQNLLLYVQQCLQRIQTYWKHSQDLPSKFMMNVSETLEEKGQGSLGQNLYHLACTGNCPPVIKEWLVNELQEAGHKRWDLTVQSSLTTLLTLIHESLLPALDRCSIVISRLRGLAQFHDSNWIFSTPLTSFDALQNLLKNMRLLAHTTLLYAGDEKRQFGMFSKWLRYEIDFEATEPGSQSREEMEGRDPGVDIAMVLEYIGHGLRKSDLTPYLRPQADLNEQQQGRPPSGYEETSKAVELLKEDASYIEEALCLEQVLKHLQGQCGKLFHQIGGWQEKSTTMDCGVVLEEGDGWEALDLRMVFDPTSPPLITTYIATYNPQTSRTSPSQPQLHIHRLTHPSIITTLPKDIHSYTLSTLSFPPSTKILDAKFADDNVLLVLLSTPTRLPSKQTTEKNEISGILISLPYTTPTSHPSAAPSDPQTQSSPSTLSYTPLPPSLLPLGSPNSRPLPTSSHTPTLTLSPDALRTLTLHTFERRFAPLKLVVNGRKGRRVVVVLGEDRKHYRVLDLDFRENGKEGGR